jgi:hypothetical protein
MSSISAMSSPSTSSSTAASVLASAVQANGVAASPGAASGSTTASTGGAATEQAAAGAQQSQQAEPFNAPRLVLPSEATTREVMVGLTRAMADPSVNKTTAQQLYSLHEQMKSAEQAMIQSILDGMSS